MKKIILSFFCISIYTVVFCQRKPIPTNDAPGNTRNNGQFGNNRNSTGTRNTSDSTKKKKANNKLDTLGFERRDDLADSISVSFRFLDSLKRQPLDSSINDFDKYYSVPTAYQYLGNNGAAAFPLIFKPFTKAGWDVGMHAFDVYKYTLENTKFYKTTGPFSMLGYQLAGGKEQMVQALHTQSPRPNTNFGFEYKLISAPGYFVTQNNNHNSVRFFGNYTGKRKRYNGLFTYFSNVFKAAENGGIKDDASLQDPVKKKRFTVPVNFGDGAFAPNPFQANINRGNTYKEKVFFLRQSYDLGKRDSIAVNDSTMEYLFYPKLRLQHTLTISTNTYNFFDPTADSIYFKNNYNVGFRKSIDSFELYEKWKSFTNDFSLIQFPDTKNAAQFILAGVSLQNLQANTKLGRFNFANLMLHGEYRNRTRNKLWDMLLKGELYLSGLNSGDYYVQANISRYLNKKWGDVNLYFINSNRTPSFIFDNRSSFNLNNINSFKKENIISFGATASNSFIQLGFRNHLLTNYAYFSDKRKTEQSSKLINVLQIFASKKIRLKKNIFYYADATLQQTDNASPIKVPLIYTRSRIAYEGSVYKNLKLSTGLEIRYYTPYKANNYSPVLGQFSVQDTFTIKNRPDVAAFFNFRIKSFSTYIRAENLNTLSFQNGFDFVANNFAAPHHPTQGFLIRFGIRWWFVK
jgi:hypothetical protein